MRARLGESVSGRNRPEENLLLTKHVVAAGRFVKDAGSTPAASTNVIRPFVSEDASCISVRSFKAVAPHKKLTKWPDVLASCSLNLHLFLIQHLFYF